MPYTGEIILSYNHLYKHMDTIPFVSGRIKSTFSSKITYHCGVAVVRNTV